MSHFSIIRDSSIALRDKLFDALTTVADVNFGFNNAANDIILSAPDSDIPDGARLSVYLYHIMPDPQLRNQRPLAFGDAGLVRAPLALRHQYLITPLLGDEAQNQLIIGRILQALHDAPFIDEVGGGPIGDSLGGGSPELRLAIEPMTLEDLSRVWHAMGSDYRLSVAFSMRIVLIDSALDPRQVGRVEESHILVETKR